MLDTKIVAVADVHGCYDLLAKTLEKYYATNSELIFLGDLIDRSPQKFGDRKVVTYVRNLQKNPQDYGLKGVTVLRGNHEQLCIDAVRSNDFELWEWNGAANSFRDYCMTNPDIVDWMDQLPYYAIRGEYLFVHAGVRPGVDIKEQDPHDLIWIRDPFLNYSHDLPYTIVHGHTIQQSETPVYGDKRISMDLGAFATGNLCTLPLTV